MASGTGGQIGLAKIGSLYRDVNTINRWSNFVSESIEHTLEELEEGAITGRRDAPPSHKGIDFSQGDIELEPNPNAIGDYLTGFFGTLASSLVTNAASTGANSGQEAGKPQWFHRFTPRQSAFSERVFLDTYNVMVYRDVGSAFIVRGAIFPTLSFDFTAGQLMKSTVSVMGRRSERIERVAAIQSLVSSGGRPWVWDMASVEVSTSDTASAGLAPRTNLEQITLNFELPHEGVVLLDGTKFYGEMQPNEFRRINIEGTMTFRDHSDYQSFIDYEARRLRLTVLNVNSNLALGNIGSLDATAFLGYYGMRIHIPQMKFLSWSAPIGGPNRLTASFTAKAEYSDADGLMAAIELNNVVPNSAYTAAY